MNLCPYKIQRLATCLWIFLLVLSLLPTHSLLITNARAQTSAATPAQVNEQLFRLEVVPIEGGAELITIHARVNGLASSGDDNWVPQVSVLRDTLGDLTPENDRLRYVWPLTYTRPTVRQKLSGAIPFLYSRVGNKNGVSQKAPPPVLDLATPDRDVWNRIFWTALQSLLLDPYGMPVKASSRSYRKNISDYRKSHIIRALSVLSLYQATGGAPTFSESEFAEINARLLLTDKTFGGIVDSLQLEPYFEKARSETQDVRGHNWELLRQRAEAESLVFEPVQMPDGNTTHALLWVAKNDLANRGSRTYEKRFLNIDNPWTDKRLLRWNGYVETRYFDSENRAVSPETPGARAVELIPLAMYGLDHPKIPILLVDFRDGLNPKKREMSRRVLQDVTSNVLSLSRFGDVPYFLGRTVFEFVTGKRGMDINQPSRLRTYSQLKLLLALDRSLSPELREEVSQRIEKVSLNPLENDLDAEAKLARQQYAALLTYARSPKGLPVKLNRDRRAELVTSEHGKAERVFFRVGSILSFGKYVHREDERPENSARLDVARRLNYHTRFLREVAQSSPRIDVLWNLEEVKNSLRYVAEHGTQADSRAVSATAKIFDRTEDRDTRRVCLESLARINRPSAKKELIRISNYKALDQVWRELIASYLKNPENVVPLSASGGKSEPNQTDQ